MTPTPAEAQAELERRKENKVRKARGEKAVHAPKSAVTLASNEELRAWAEGKT